MKTYFFNKKPKICTICSSLIIFIFYIWITNLLEVSFLCLISVSYLSVLRKFSLNHPLGSQSFQLTGHSSSMMILFYYCVVTVSSNHTLTSLHFHAQVKILLFVYSMEVGTSEKNYTSVRIIAQSLSKHEELL